MPGYKGKKCRGLCERHGRSCIRTNLYRDVADTLGFEPKPIIGDDKNQHSLWINRGEPGYRIAVSTALREINRNPRYHNVPLGHLLSEYPCHTTCGITICSVCHKQHPITDRTTTDWCPYLHNDEMNEPEEVTYSWTNINKQGKGE